MVWYSLLFQNFPQFVVSHTVKGFGIVSKAEIDVFLELSCFFDDPADVGNLISAFSKTNLNIWKFMVHVLLKTGLENFEQKQSLFLSLPGHRAVDDASVLFHPTPPHHLRQDQALQSCVCHRDYSVAQASILWSFRDRLRVLPFFFFFLRVLPIELAYSPALPPLPLTMGFHSVLPVSPSVLSSGDLLELMAMPPPQGQGACGRR